MKSMFKLHCIHTKCLRRKFKSNHFMNMMRHHLVTKSALLKYDRDICMCWSLFFEKEVLKRRFDKTDGANHFSLTNYKENANKQILCLS